MCDEYLDHGAHCVIVARTAQPTDGWVTIVIQKCVYLMKRSRLAICLLEVANLADFSVALLFICALFLYTWTLYAYEPNYMAE